jgi:hypothetical protein
MRRPSYQKTSPRTLALPGFVVSGISKMRGLMGSAVSFERVQMGPYPGSPLLLLETGPFEASHSNPGSAPCGRSSSRLDDHERTRTGALYLNAFKRQPFAPMPSTRRAVEKTIAMGLSTPIDGGRAESPLDHAPRGPSPQRRPLAGCRGMERAYGRRLRLMLGPLGQRLSQIPRTQAATTREPIAAPHPVLDLWNIDWLIAIEEPSSTERMPTCFSFASGSAVAERPRLRTPVRPFEARSADAVRDTAASHFASMSLCTTPDLDTRSSSSIEARLRSVSQRACTATEAVDRKTRRAHGTGSPRSSDRSRSSSTEADLSAPGEAICRTSSEWLPRAYSAGAIFITCVRLPRKILASMTSLAPAPGLHRPQQRRTLQSVRTRPEANPFERVQMRPRPHPIYRAGRTPARAETSGP